MRVGYVLGLDPDPAGSVVSTLSFIRRLMSDSSVEYLWNDCHTSASSLLAVGVRAIANSGALGARSGRSAHVLVSGFLGVGKRNRLNIAEHLSGCEILHLMDGNALPYVGSLPSLPKVVSVPDSMHFEGPMSQRFGPVGLLHRMSYFNLSKVNHVVTYSQFSKRALQRVFGKRLPPTTVIQFPVLMSRRLPRQAARRSLGLPSEGGIGLQVSSTAPWKGLETFYDVAEMIPECKFIRVGAPLRTGSVSHEQKVSRERLELLYSAADFLISTSTYEGACMPLYEAIGCGLPVISSSIEPAREALGSAGLYADSSGSVGSYVEAIRALLSSPDLQRRISDSMKARRLSLSPEEFIAQLVGVYSRVGRQLS